LASQAFTARQSRRRVASEIVEQFGSLANIKPTEKPALHHDGVTGIQTRQFLERGVQAQYVFLTRRRLVERILSTALLRCAAASGLNEQLAHCARRDAFEMQARSGGESRRSSELHPCLVYQGRRIQCGTAVIAFYRPSQAAQFLIGRAEEQIQFGAVEPGIISILVIGMTVLSPRLRIA
jgi:hypothetical protein